MLALRAMAVASATRSWWTTPPGLLLAAALASGMVAWWLIAEPVATLSNVATHPDHFRMVFTHMLGGTLMLFVGAANLYVGATRRFFRWHKQLGFLYLAGGAVGASMAILLAVASPHEHRGQTIAFSFASTTDTGYALVMLGTAWLAAASMAWRAARNRRYDSHRQWMIRSYVLVWSFVFCRLVGRAPMGDFGKSAAVIWLTWIIPLLACEVALQWNAGRRTPKSDVAMR